MNRTLELLARCGCDVNVGIERSMGKEGYYLKKLRRFADCDYIEKMEDAYRRKDMEKCRLYACSLNSSYFDLGLKPMYYLNSYILNNARGGLYRDVGEILRQLVACHSSFLTLVTAEQPTENILKYQEDSLQNLINKMC